MGLLGASSFLVLGLLITLGEASPTEQCRATLDAMLLEKSNDSISWGDVATAYRSSLCNNQVSIAEWSPYRTTAESMFEAMVFEPSRAAFSSAATRDSSILNRLCNYLDALVVASGCNDDEKTMTTQHRRTEDANCPLDLLESVQQDSDGYLSLAEYNRFFTNRYYSRCGVAFDVDSVSGVSEAQSDAFVALACLACLRDIGTVAMLPDCCRPENARISLNNPDPYTFTRICTTARTAAAEDCSYLALLTTAQPQQNRHMPPTPTAPTQTIGIPPSTLFAPPAVTPTSFTTPISVPTPLQIPQPSAVQVPTQPLSQCSRQLLSSDSYPGDGMLTSSEFTSFLVQRYGHPCIMRQPETSIQALFLHLACSSCLASAGATLDCCLPNVARISVSEAHDQSERHWIERICFNSDSEIGAFCSVAPIPPLPVSPPIPPPLPMPIAAPLVAPASVAPITMHPVSFPTVNAPATESPSSHPALTVNPFPSGTPVEMGRHSSPSPTKSIPTLEGSLPTRSPIQAIILTSPPSFSVANPVVEEPPLITTFAPTPPGTTNATTATSTFTLPPIPSPLQEPAESSALSASRQWVVILLLLGIVGLVTMG